MCIRDRCCVVWRARAADFFFLHAVLADARFQARASSVRYRWGPGALYPRGRAELGRYGQYRSS
eukprot:2044132-Heterocapsa_arctica.AAC.1